MAYIKNILRAPVRSPVRDSGGGGGGTPSVILANATFTRRKDTGGWNGRGGFWMSQDRSNVLMSSTESTQVLRYGSLTVAGDVSTLVAGSQLNTGFSNPNSYNCFSSDDGLRAFYWEGSNQRAKALGNPSAFSLDSPSSDGVTANMGSFGFTLSADGAYFYTMPTAGYLLRRYPLDPVWDIAALPAANFDKEIAINSIPGGPTDIAALYGLTLTDDGRILLVAENGEIHSYYFETAYDPETAVYVDSLDVSAVPTPPLQAEVFMDAGKLYFTSGTGAPTYLEEWDLNL